MPVRHGILQRLKVDVVPQAKVSDFHVIAVLVEKHVLHRSAFRCGIFLHWFLRPGLWCCWCWALFCFCHSYSRRRGNRSRLSNWRSSLCMIGFFNHRIHLFGFSFLPDLTSQRFTPFTSATLYLSPGIAPSWPLCEPPRPSIVTSSCSSMKLIEPSNGTNAPTILLFFMSWTFTHLIFPEFGCFWSSMNFCNTRAFALGLLPRASYFCLSLRTFRLYHFLRRRWCLRCLRSFLAANSPFAMLSITLIKYVRVARRYDRKRRDRIRLSAHGAQLR